MFREVGHKPQGNLKTYIVRIKGNISRTRSVRISYDSTIAKHFSVPEKQLVKRNLSQDISFAWSGSEQQFNRLIQNWKREYTNFPIDYDYVIEDQSEKYERKSRKNQEFVGEDFDRKFDDFDEYRRYGGQMRSRNMMDYEYGSYERRGHHRRRQIIGHYSGYNEPKFMKNSVNFYPETSQSTLKPIQTIIIKEEQPNYQQVKVPESANIHNPTLNRNENKILKLLRELKQKRTKRNAQNDSTQNRERSRQKKGSFSACARKQGGKENRITLESIGETDFVNLCRASNMHRIIDYGSIAENIISIPYKVIGLRMKDRSGKSVTLSMLYYYLHCDFKQHQEEINSLFLTSTSQMHQFAVLSINLFDLISVPQILARIILKGTSPPSIQSIIHQEVIKCSLKQLHSLLMTHSQLGQNPQTHKKYHQLLKYLQKLNKNEDDTEVSMCDISYCLNELVTSVSGFYQNRKVVLLMDDFDGPIRKCIEVIEDAIEDVGGQKAKGSFLFVLKEMVLQLLNNISKNQYLSKVIITYAHSLSHSFYEYSPNIHLTDQQLHTLLQSLPFIEKQPTINQLSLLFNSTYTPQSPETPNYPLTHTLIYLTKAIHSHPTKYKIEYKDYFHQKWIQILLKGFDLRLLCTVCDDSQGRGKVEGKYELVEEYLRKDRSMEMLVRLLIELGILMKKEEKIMFENRLGFGIFQDVIVDLSCKDKLLNDSLMSNSGISETQQINRVFHSLLKSLSISSLSNPITLQLLLAITSKHTNCQKFTYLTPEGTPVIIIHKHSQFYLYSLIKPQSPQITTFQIFNNQIKNLLQGNNYKQPCTLQFFIIISDRIDTLITKVYQTTLQASALDCPSD